MIEVSGIIMAHCDFAPHFWQGLLLTLQSILLQPYHVMTDVLQINTTVQSGERWRNVDNGCVSLVSSER